MKGKLRLHTGDLVKALFSCPRVKINDGHLGIIIEVEREFYSGGYVTDRALVMWQNGTRSHEPVSPGTLARIATESEEMRMENDFQKGTMVVRKADGSVIGMVVGKADDPSKVKVLWDGDGRYVLAKKSSLRRVK